MILDYIKSRILLSLMLGMVSLGQSSASVVCDEQSRQTVRDYQSIRNEQTVRDDGKTASRKADAEQLAKALDYFSSQKYHECLIILQPLDQRYRLNPRYRACLGVCLYYEQEYADAIKVFDVVLPQLKALAPQERSLYYWMSAESHFLLQRYQEAQPLYEQMLPLCHDNERPDAYYRLGFCHLFAAETASNDSGATSGSAASQDLILSEKKKAKECFEQALLGYLKYRNTPDEKARIAQIKHMILGLKSPTDSTD